MHKRMLNSEFFRFLTGDGGDETRPERVPTLQSLSDELGVSVSRLREQLVVARALGFVEVRPRTGIRRLPYTFTPAVRQSLNYAIQIDRKYFDLFSDLRNHVEAAYWHQAVRCLKPKDHQLLQELVARAWKKLQGTPIRIPHREHRELHLTIFRRVDNPFVLGIIEAYWEAYEAVGLNLYADYQYLEEVWRYHQKMVDAICSGDYDVGYEALVDHKDLLYHRDSVSETGGERRAISHSVE